MHFRIECFLSGKLWNRHSDNPVPGTRQFAQNYFFLLFPFFYMCVGVYVCMFCMCVGVHVCMFCMSVGDHACGSMRLILKFILEYSSTFFIETGFLSQTQSSLLCAFFLECMLWGSMLSIWLDEH